MAASTRIYITESQLKMLCEAEWNFHYSKEGMPHDFTRPYGSDSKYVMPNRGTGHFGSGTYFSTYPDKGLQQKYKDGNPEFIQVDDRLYRVDFDLYKNLYRVRTEKQGDILFAMCRRLNAMYNKIAKPDSGKGFDAKKANYDNSEDYQVIKANAEALGLKCPSYFQLTRMAQRHTGDQSFSTVFMEYNGFNGVNVSGVRAYDNTTHGSVIYDLSKTSDELHPVKLNIPFGMEDYGYNANAIAYDTMSNPEITAMKGKTVFWLGKLNEYPTDKALRILKNYTRSGSVLKAFWIEQMNPSMRRHYLRMIYNKAVNNPDEYFIREIFNQDDKLANIIIDNEAYYWVNLTYSWHSMLIEVLSAYEWKLDWNLSDEEQRVKKEQFLAKLKTYLKRPLNKHELSYIEEDY